MNDLLVSKLPSHNTATEMETHLHSCLCPVCYLHSNVTLVEKRKEVMINCVKLCFNNIKTSKKKEDF